MSIPDGAILRIVLSLLFPDSAIAQNVFYTVFTDTGTSDDDDDVLTDLETWIETIYANLNAAVDSGISMAGMKVYIYDASDPDWDEVGVAFPTDGFSGAGDAMPNGVAALSHATTTNPDVTGAKYWGGNTDTSTVENDYTAGSLAAYQNACDDWVTNFVGAVTGADFGPGVWSPTKTNFFLFNGVYSTNAQVAYQRRRKPGVGI